MTIFDVLVFSAKFFVSVIAFLVLANAAFSC